MSTSDNRVCTFRIKYVIKDSYEIQYYTVLCNETRELHDFTPSQIREKVYKYLQNCQVINGSIITDAPELYVGGDISKAQGRVITGWNDLETWCIKNKKPGILAAFIAGNNGINPQRVAYKSGKYYKFKCKAKLLDGTICNAERVQILKSVVNTTAPDFVCLECRAREGKAVTLVRGVNDLETWCKQHNRQDILDAWDYNQGISPSEVQAKNYTTKVNIKCRICGNIMSISPLSLTKYPTATVCEACRATGTSVPQLVLDKLLKNRFKSVQYRHKLGVSHFELDEYIADLNLGIEYNGLWHDTEEVMIRDYNKQLICNQLNIPVLYINENGERKPPEIKNGSIEIWRNSTRSIEPYQFILDVIQNRFNIVLNPITDKEIENALNSAYSIIKRDSVPNNITITHPDKAATWDYEKNGSLRPEMFTAGSGQRVYWKCTECKIPHSYLMDIRHRCTRNQSCPVKAGQLVVAGVNDIGTTAPHLLKFWDYDKNSKIELKPEYISIGQNTQVFWKCPECGYRWFVSPNEFRSLKRCKCCKTPINRS